MCAFLQAFVRFLRSTRRSFSYRQFAHAAGFRTPNYLRLVADGKRRLSPQSIPRFASALGLSDKEHDGFEALVLLDRAKTDRERNRQFARLNQMRRTSQTKALTTYDVYSQWYVLPIREMVNLPGFELDSEWIATRLRPRILKSEAQHAIDLLLRTGLIRRREDGTVEQSDGALATPANVRSLAVRNYHRSMLQSAEASLDGLPQGERNITSVTMTLSKTQYDDVCELVERFRLQLIERFEKSDVTESHKEVYQIGFQIVPVTKQGERK